MTRNQLQSSGRHHPGPEYGTTGASTPITSLSGTVTFAANFPMNFVKDGAYFYVTEFNFSQGTSGSLNPSRVLKIKAD